MRQPCHENFVWHNCIALLIVVVTCNIVCSTTASGDDVAVAINQQGNENESPQDFKTWTCDELTPNLCPDLKVTESGKVPIRHGLSVQYWKYERLSNDTKNDVSGDGIPLILIHGGPAFTHNYMLPLKQQACQGRAVYLYDQAGCGESTLPANITNITKDLPFLLDKYYYATEELPKLIEYWGLTRYHILGNSWGTILSQYYALQTNRPKGLVSLTLSGPLSDGDLYQQSQWDPAVGNLGSLPPWVQRRIRSLEDDGSYDKAEYKSIADVLTTFFTLRTAPAPDCWEMAEAGVNMEIYVGMQGASEFTFGGTLAHFNTTPDLPSLRIPVLLTSGQFDTMRPPVVDAMYRSIPKVEWTVFRHSGHVSMIDDAGIMNDAVDDFLNRVEAAYWSNTNFVPNKDACGPPGCSSKYEEATTVHTLSSAQTRTVIDAGVGGNGNSREWVLASSSFVLGSLISLLVTQYIIRVAASKDGYRPL